MSIAITEDHRALAATVSDFLAARGARKAARELLEAETEALPAFWGELGELGWLGLHLPEEYGGSGFGLPELVVVVEQLGRAVAPGPFVPSVIASAVLAEIAPPEVRARLLPGLASGAAVGAAALGGEVTVRDGAGHGPAGVVLSGHLADVLLVPAGEDVLVVEPAAGGVTAEVPANIDPTRRAARVNLDGARGVLLPGGRAVLTGLARLILAAEATGIARETTEQAAQYAKVREQFGRPIATFQAVKHHCANMLVAAEVATAAVWDAARAGAGEQFGYTAAIAAALAVPAAVSNAQLNIQVHGGIGFTWEHDAHLSLRRAAAIAAVTGADAAAADVTGLVRRGIRRAAAIDLPPEAEPIRATVRQEVERLRDLGEDARPQALIESGLLMPHWPRPWGRDAGAVEQLVIEQEFAAAGLKRPSYGITGWVILTLIQHGSPDQVARWVPPALNQDVIWCQLFSEPGAGSDAAGIRTRGTRTDGGWLVNGQKVWTSGAHMARFGFATVRTNADAPKHNGITTMVIDMQAPGVSVRPLKMPTGNSDFNEVFFDDVFVPDDDVVGPVDGGWTVARATLGNESVSIGGGAGSLLSLPPDALIGPLDAHPGRLAGGEVRVGRHLANVQAMTALNLRAAHRAVAGGGPGPEGNVTKLLLSENGHEAAAILAALAGPDLAFLEGPGAMAGLLVLLNRSMSIAGGTSEIKRNQIAERILGLPRDPLIR
ncbi:MAG TPA: acyl-CoA dehydrogenase [Streptosporangiaceae bacterium]|nr:acyl-CoA dehydrogenase [Streptosporangiaceae bacterium]